MAEEEKSLIEDEPSLAEAAPELEDVEALKQTLAEEKANAEGYLANWQRAQADFINYKRRSEQEKGEISKLANATLMLNLLPVFDDLERAFASLPTSLAGFTWVDGIMIIYRKMEAALKAHGLSGIEATGHKFDPNLHEAVMYEDGEEGMVIKELQKGYKLHDRVLRPTMVTVGKGKEEKEEESDTPEQGG